MISTKYQRNSFFVFSPHFRSTLKLNFYILIITELLAKAVENYRNF